MAEQEVLGAEWADVRSLLFMLRQVSEAHFRRWRARQEDAEEYWSWSVYEQLNHMHSEVSEVYTAIRSGHDKQILDELWDVIFSTITAAHVCGYDDEAILRGMIRCLRKIQERVKEATP